MNIEVTKPVVEGEWIWTAARVVAPDGTLLTLANVNSWDLRVFRDGDGGADSPVYELLSQSPTLVMQSEPQIDEFWKDQPAPGYTFLAKQEIGSGTFETEGGQSVMLEYTLNTASYGPGYITRYAPVKSRRSV